MSSIVIQLAINNCFVINMVLFITVFAQYSNMEYAHYFYISILGRAYCVFKLVIYPIRYVLRQFKAINFVYCILHFVVMVKHICYNLSRYMLQLTPPHVTTYPATCYNLPRHMLQLVPLLVAPYPATCCNLPRYLLQLTPLPVVTYPAICCTLPRYLMQLTPLPVATYPSICCNLSRIGDLIKCISKQMSIALYICLCTCYMWEIVAICGR